MLEFFTNYHAADIIVKLCQYLVKEEVAMCARDSREGEAQIEKYIKDEEMIRDLREENRERRFGVVVYHNFVIATKPSKPLSFEPHISVVRIWFDKHTRQAGIKISEDDLIALAQTMSVLHLLRKLDLSLGNSKNGQLDIDKIAEVISQAVSKVSPEAKATFTVKRREKNRR